MKGVLVLAFFNDIPDGRGAAGMVIMTFVVSSSHVYIKILFGPIAQNNA